MKRTSDDWRDDPDISDDDDIFADEENPDGSDYGAFDDDGDGDLFADREDDPLADENASDEDFTDDDEEYTAQLYSVLYAVDHFHF